MNTYTIRINIDIVPSTEPATNAPIEQHDGSVQMTLTQQEANNIDRCEQALLQTTYPTLRKALSTHLSEMAKQDAMEHLTEGQVVTTSWKGRVDGEIGRFEFVTYQIRHDHKPVMNTASTLFSGLKRWDWYRTSGFKELAFIYGTTEDSYRKTHTLINRVRYQPEKGTPSRTLREQTEHEGTKLGQAIDRKAEQILTANAFRENGMFEGAPETYHTASPECLAGERVAAAIAICQARVTVDADLRDNPVPYELPEQTVNLSADDVGVKRQTATRECQRDGDEEPTRDMAGKKEVKEAVKKEVKEEVKKKKRKYVHQTVVHLEHAGQSYLIHGRGIKHVLSLVIAFLLNSDLLHYRLQFFTDGYTILHHPIPWRFPWYPILATILDWHHVEKKM